MSQSEKGSKWHFSMKAHVGVDAKSGLIHTVKSTTGKVHDARLTDDLVRAKVGHVFRIIKCQFGYRKTRYRGLAKNAAQVFSLMALANLYLARRELRVESV